MTPQHPFFKAFVECLLFCGVSTDDPDDELNTHLSDQHLSTEAKNQLLGDCEDFLDRADDLLDGLDQRSCAHDFFYSREGHGTGFWDRNLGLIGERLDALAKTFSACEPYLGDDGLIHVTPTTRLKRPDLSRLTLFSQPVPESPRYLW